MRFEQWHFVKQQMETWLYPFLIFFGVLTAFKLMMMAKLAVAE